VGGYGCFWVGNKVGFCKKNIGEKKGGFVIFSVINGHSSTLKFQVVKI
jgi:hypothetical protein